MKNAPQVNEGDRVRVVLEGEAWKRRIVGGGSFWLGSHPSDNLISTHAEHVVSVEVLAKPYKVGDTVSGDDYAKLPVGTQVKDSCRYYKIDADRWVSKWDDYANSHLSSPCTIVYLPDAS